jgi:hypothetical protein
LNGGIEDFLAKVESQQDSAQIFACTVAGNNASAEITRYRSDLSANWHPTGFYTADQIDEIVGAVGKMAASATDLLDRAYSDVVDMPASEFPSILSSERKGLVGWIEQGSKFTAAANAVRQAGDGIVDAPGLKAWVLSVLARVDSTITAAAATGCLQPWWASLYRGASAILNAAWATIKAVVGTIAKIGEFIVSVPDTVATLLKVAKWGGLAVGALVLLYYGKKALETYGYLSPGHAAGSPVSDYSGSDDDGSYDDGYEDVDD